MSSTIINSDQYAEIESAVRNAIGQAYRYTSMEYRVYIDPDGSVGIEERIAGDTFVCSDREYIYTACHKGYSVLWDYWFDDSAAFSAAFTDQFKIEIFTDNGDSLNENALSVCEDNEIPTKEYEDWLDEQEELAIEDIMQNLESDGTLAEIVDNALREAGIEEE